MAEELPYISLKGVEFGYEGAPLLFKGLSAGFDLSSTTLLCGANGAGKTSLLKLVMGILHASRGSICVAGCNPATTPLHTMAGHIAVSPQKAEYQIFHSTVAEEIAFGPRNLSRGEVDSLVLDSMKLFALADVQGKHPYDLHPSRRKLLSLASAYAMDTPFMILDEPTAGLSKPEKEILSSALVRLRERKRGYILISHDLSFSLGHCERVLLLAKGEVAANDTIREFLTRPRAEGVLKRAETRMPGIARFSRLLGILPVARTADEFVLSLKERQHDH